LLEPETMLRSRTKWIAILAVGVAGCFAEPPVVEDPEGNPAVDAGPAEGEDADVDVPLSITQIAETTPWDTVPVRGVGPERGTVLVETPSHGTKTAELGSDGTFCIDVPLDLETVNVLRFQAIDDEGRYSEEEVAEVTQEGTPPEPPEPEEPENAALGATVDRMSISATGDLGALSDGDHETSVFIENSMWHNDWLILTLEEPTGVELIRVVSGIDCPMEEYMVWMTPEAAPEDPSDNPEGDDWALVYHVEAGDGDEAFLLHEPAVVSHLAIVFLSGDCGSFYEPGEHVVREIEAWTPEPPEPPVETAPTCFGS
jgi:hypothetical protein